MMTVKRNKGGIAEQIRRFREIDATTAEIGWNDPINASKAYLNERGGASSDGHTIPPRPFIKPAIVKIQEGGVCKAFVEALKKGKTKEAFAKEGDSIKEAIQVKIDEVENPPLSEKTVEERFMKGSEHYVAGLFKPLIETGEMRNSIEVNVKQGAEE